MSAGCFPLCCTTWTTPSITKSQATDCPMDYRLSPVHRLLRRGQDQLIKCQVQPPAELESRLTDRAAMLEAHRLMQRDAYRVRGVNAPNQSVIILSLGGGDNFREQPP